MNRVLSFLLFAATTLVVVGCLREQAPVHDSPRISIRAYIPEEPLSKASFSVPTSGVGLHLAWQANDNIRVINADNPAASEVYDIQDGFTDHVATFSGKAVAGDQFNIICPGSYASVAEAGIGKTLSQTGNGSTDHLFFTALLANVDKADLSEITFSEEWVSAHPGTTLKLGGIVRFVLTLPDALTQPTKVVLSAPNVNVSVNIEGVTLSTEHILTAYAPSSWADIDLPAGTALTVAVYDAGGAYYSVTKTLGADKTLKAGAQNLITIDGGFTEQLFAGGDGTPANPYLIATAKQLDNIRTVLASEQKKHFRLIEDIDMEAYLAKTPWEPLNWKNPYDCPVDFDGDNHTIDHFSCKHSGQSWDKPAFFGLLYGECYDVNFTNAVIENNSNVAGILAGYCGYPNKKATVTNVHVQGSVSQTEGSTGVGGLAGRAANAVISSCSADVIITSSVNYTGGLVGLDRDMPIIIQNCWTSGSVSGNQRVGGIMGGITISQSEIINCFSTAAVSASRCLGGIAGHCNLDDSSGAACETTYPDNLVKGCIAWQTTLETRTKKNTTDSFWSSGAILGFTSRHTYLTDCKRNPSLSFTDFNPSLTLYDQNNATPDSPLSVTNPNPSLLKHLSPYHGQAAASTNLSTVAKSLGWNESAWDLSGDTPVLTGVIEPVAATTSGNDNVPLGTNIDRAFPVNGTKNGVTWTVTQVGEGLRYYHGYGKPTESWMAGGGTTWQEVYVTDYDLTKTDYEVKLVVASPGAITSKVFEQTGAVAAINCGYEKASVAIKTNAFLNTSTGDFTDYPGGYSYSFMPNNTIADTGIANWKNEGAFYCDGKQGVRIAFDSYNGGCTDNNGTGTTVKAINDERLFYKLGTYSEPAFVSSAPILTANYTLFGRTFVTRNPDTSKSESPGKHQDSKYPRTAVAIAYPDGVTPHLLLIACDGRYAESTERGYGMSALWLTRYMANYFGPRYMLNLDGGGSTTMCVKDQGDPTTHVVNYPCDNYTEGGIIDHGGERKRDTFIVIVPKN